jgi:hypothetical protein
VAFEVEIDLEPVIECNCSICRRKGHLLAFAPRGALNVLQGEENLSTYTFNSHRIQHRFCATCGVATFGEAGSRPARPRRPSTCAASRASSCRISRSRRSTGGISKFWTNPCLRGLWANL